LLREFKKNSVTFIAFSLQGIILSSIPEISFSPRVLLRAKFEGETFLQGK
jgi:hypothetical protein